MWIKSTDLAANTYLINIARFDSISIDPCGDLIIQNSANGDYYRNTSFIFKDINKANAALMSIAEAIANQIPFLDLDAIVK